MGKYIKVIKILGVSRATEGRSSEATRHLELIGTRKTKSQHHYKRKVNRLPIKCEPNQIHSKNQSWPSALMNVLYGIYTKLRKKESTINIIITNISL
jgi:hypothetical protein